MVQGHLTPAQALACGWRVASSASSAWAATQGAYRFLHNPRVLLPTLVKPLLEVARTAVPETCDRYVLAIHDWSLLRYRRHHSKADRMTLKGKAWAEGYELHSCLLVDDRSGNPLAPVSMSLHTAEGAHCTRSRNVRPIRSVLDEIDPVMTFVEQQALARPAVHILDAEADSVAHYRLWSQHAGRYYLVRADDRLVELAGVEQKCSQVHKALQEQGVFRHSREVVYHRQPAQQYVAEASVRLLRPGQQNRADGSRARVSGAPLALRLIIAEVRSEQGEVLATWYLLTNVPLEVDSSTIAIWYYWRWRIETFFKLLKSAGMNLEQWQQESAAALLRRLLVACMACVIVWQLARDTTPEAAESREFLVRLSGRLIERGKRFTEPALLAGLWVLLQIQAALTRYDVETLQRIAAFALPNSRASPTPASKDV
jgi:hypothetical protein